MYTVDNVYNIDHEAAIKVACRALRPFTRFYVIGKPVTYNLDLLEEKTYDPTVETNVSRDTSGWARPF
jgi:hypothetical protein